MNFDIDLETEKAKRGFMEWLDHKVDQERFKMNFWYYFNNLGLIFTDSKDYIPMGRPVIFGTGGGFDCDSTVFKQIWAKPENYKIIDNSWSDEKTTGYFVPSNNYIVGIDPYQIDE